MSIYPFDQTGMNPANLIKSESVSIATINGLEHNYITPKDAPFFSESLTVVDADTGRILDRDVDYVLTHKFQEGFDNLARGIYGSFAFLDLNLTGNFNITYRTIGGDFVTAASRLVANGMDALVNLQNADWTDLYNVPVTWPPTYHTQPITDLSAVADIINVMQEIRDNIANPYNRLTLDDVTDLESGFITPLLNELSNLTGAVIAKSTETKLYYEQAMTGTGLSDLGPQPKDTWFYGELTVTISVTGQYLVSWGIPSAAVRDAGAFVESRFVVNDQVVTASHSNNGQVALAAGDVIKLQHRVVEVDATEFRVGTSGAGSTLTAMRIA